MEYLELVCLVNVEKAAPRDLLECREDLVRRVILEQLDLRALLVLLALRVTRVLREPRDSRVRRVPTACQGRRVFRARWDRSVRRDTRDLPDQRVPPDPEASRGRSGLVGNGDHPGRRGGTE